MQPNDLRIQASALRAALGMSAMGFLPAGITKHQLIERAEQITGETYADTQQAADGISKWIDAQILELDQDRQARIIELWAKDCPLDVLCDEVDLDPEVIAEFLRSEKLA